jgi:hypothetical protein
LTGLCVFHAAEPAVIQRMWAIVLGRQAGMKNEGE